MSCSVLADLELDLREKLCFKSDLEFVIHSIPSAAAEGEEEKKQTIVSLRTTSFSGYVPCFPTLIANVEEGREICLKKAICFIEMVQEMKYGLEELEEKISPNFSKLYAKKLQLLQRPNTEQTSDLTQEGFFSNWIGKQRARFRIKKTEKTEIKAHLVPTGALKRSLEAKAATTLAENPHLDSTLKPNERPESPIEEPADVKILCICEQLSLPMPNFTYQECQASNEIRCSLEFLGQTFTASQIGGKRIQIKERVSQIALDTCKYKLQEMHYQRKQLESFSSSNLQLQNIVPQPAASMPSTLSNLPALKNSIQQMNSEEHSSEFVPVNVGKLVEIDINRINNPLKELDSETQIDQNNIPSNILSMLSIFARRKRLKSPDYTIKTIGFCFTGSATFAGHQFDLEGKSFSSKKEAKFQLAYLIWKSLKSVSAEIDLDGSIAASGPSPKERHQKFMKQFKGSAEAKYSLSPEIDQTRTGLPGANSQSSALIPPTSVAAANSIFPPHSIPRTPLMNSNYQFYPPMLPNSHYFEGNYAYAPQFAQLRQKRHFLPPRAPENRDYYENNKRPRASNYHSMPRTGYFPITDAFPSLKRSPRKRPTPFDRPIPQITTHPMHHASSFPSRGSNNGSDLHLRPSNANHHDTAQNTPSSREQSHLNSLYANFPSNTHSPANNFPSRPKEASHPKIPPSLSSVLPQQQPTATFVKHRLGAKKQP